MPAQPDFESCPRNDSNCHKDEKGLPRNIHARYGSRYVKCNIAVGLRHCAEAGYWPVSEASGLVCFPQWPNLKLTGFGTGGKIVAWVRLNDQLVPNAGHLWF